MRRVLDDAGLQLGGPMPWSPRMPDREEHGAGAAFHQQFTEADHHDALHSRLSVAASTPDRT